MVFYSVMVHGDLDPVVMKLKEDFEELKATLTAQMSDLDELKSENVVLKANLTAQKSDLATLKAENDELKDTVDALKSENAEQAEEISFLRNPPFYHLCVFQGYTEATSS